jgi:hypothetical protein
MYILYIGKGRLSLGSLYDIHAHMIQSIGSYKNAAAGGGRGGGGAGAITDLYVSVGVEKIGMGEDGGKGERDPCVLGERKFQLKPAADIMAAALAQVGGCGCVGVWVCGCVYTHTKCVCVCVFVCVCVCVCTC